MNGDDGFEKPSNLGFGAAPYAQIQGRFETIITVHTIYLGCEDLYPPLSGLRLRENGPRGGARHYVERRAQKLGCHPRQLVPCATTLRL